MNDKIPTDYKPVQKTKFTLEEAQGLNRQQRRELGKLNGNIKIKGTQVPYRKTRD